MTREREIFHEALEQPSPEARAAFLERATAGDPKLRNAVDELLANNQEDAFLEQGVAEPIRQSLESAGKLTLHEEQIGDCIGRYKILEKIGEGGFGVVYRAEQSEPVRRHVALKVIKLGMDTKSIIVRFEAERQALALMDHPGIARVLDGGATVAGRPFFVMELVRGIRITEYCQANQLALEDRVALFIQLCNAIQHAHQKGVIHRDLKPSNVLVTVQDGKPVPKVIDFGIAKAIEEPLTEKTVWTNFHAFIGTPVYTSPEQAEMTGSDVDTRSDIYSLGVLLYELLTGVTPFDAKELTQSGLEGMRRVIKEVEPPKPSTRLQRALTSQSQNEPAVFVDRDMDWIIMKCLEKDRTRRYSTAQELAADLQRYLSQEPVLARPQSASYRLRKAIRRHRTAFSAAAVIFVVVVAGATVSAWQAVRATRAEHLAELGHQREEALRLKAEQERERALENQQRAERNEYVADISLAHHSISAGNLDQAIALLSKHRAEGLQQFEWRYLWHSAQGDDNRLVAQESSSILSLANTADWLAVGLRDSVRIYSPQSGALVKTLAKPGVSVSLSSAGLLATASKTAVRVWRTNDWTEVYSLPDITGPVAFSSDGRLLAANSMTGVHIYTGSDGKLLSEIPGGVSPFVWSPGGNVIAVDTSQGIGLWDVNAGRLLRVLEGSDQLFADPRTRSMNGLVFSPDGHSIVAARNTLRESSVFVCDVWDCESGHKTASMPVHHNAVEHSGMITSLAFSPGGQILASGSHDHSVRLWDFHTRQRIETLHGNSSEVWALVFGADGRGVYSGAKDGAVRLWPTNAAPRERSFEGAWTPLKFSKDGQVLAALDEHSKWVLMNLRTGEPEDQVQLTGIKAEPLRFLFRAISDDLHLLALPLSEGGIRVWDLQSKKSLDFDSRQTRIAWTAISPDGSTLLAGGERDSILWWNLRDRTEAPMRVQGKDAVFSRNGEILVTLHDKSFKTWDPRARLPKAEFIVNADLGFGTAFTLSDDGRVLAVGANAITESDNVIRLWDTSTGKLVGVCKGHSQGVRWLAFAPNAETLASVGDDGTLRFWNVRTQQQLLSIQRVADPVRDIVFSQDGNWLAAKTMSGLRLLDGSREGLAAKTAVQQTSSTGQ